MSTSELIEQLVDKEHASWSHWMTYLFSKCQRAADGSVIIPADLVDRWQRQAATPYAALTEREKESDRSRVRLIVLLITDRIVKL